ncbi:MAG: hypothetical protein GY705_03890 [Bacteroidetes bacterium]|nr:hypothetical protein [Bacteroidota bacterium]
MFYIGEKSDEYLMRDGSKNAGISDPSDQFPSTSKVYRKSTISEETSSVKKPKKTSGPSCKCISLTLGIIIVGILVGIVSAVYNQSKVIPPPLPSKNQEQKIG